MHTLYKKSVQVNKKRRTVRCGIRVGQGKVWSFEVSWEGLCGVALGPLFGYPVVLRSVVCVLSGDASHQRVGFKRVSRVLV